MFCCACCQALDARNEREQRAIQLIDVLSECRDELLPLICEALNADGQQQIVNDFIRRNNLQQPAGMIIAVMNIHISSNVEYNIVHQSIDVSILIPSILFSLPSPPPLSDLGLLQSPQLEGQPSSSSLSP